MRDEVLEPIGSVNVKSLDGVNVAVQCEPC